MGGPGSGFRISKKTTVEDCLTLDINKLVRKGIIQPGIWNNHGSLTWTNTATGETVSSVGYWVSTCGDTGPYFRLLYTIKSTGEELEYKITLETTCPYYGGLRWWFICPLTRGGQHCGHRVSKLHIPPGGKYYGCRHCYNLTYQSCQDSHKFDRYYAELADRITGITGSDVKQILSKGR
jgi:hypothetical protein